MKKLRNFVFTRTSNNTVNIKTESITHVSGSNLSNTTFIGLK